MAIGAGTAILASGLLSSAGQLYANRENIKYQQGANDTQIALANTAHQREVRDLIAAGLNPILSAQGSGAAVPQLTAAGVANPGEGVAGALSSAAKVQALEIPKVESQVAVNSATAKNLEAQNENLQAQNDLIKSQKREADAKAYKAVMDADAPGAFGGFMRTMNQIFGETYGTKVADRMKESDPPSSAKKVHDIGTLEVEAPAHRWYHHLPGFRD